MLPAEEFGPANTGTGLYTAFLSKLWKIVNDPNTDDLIKWSEKGMSFFITDQTKFTQELVPKYFKHNNMASFIRQLNMYGFRKVISVEAGGLAVDKGEIEFSHPQFIKGQPSLIRQIKRKPQSSRAVATTEGTPHASNILHEVQTLRLTQENMGSKLIGIKKENELLWREYANMRQKFSKQQQIIEKLVQFLVAMVKSPNQTLTPKRKFTHLALEGVEGSSSSTNAIISDQDSPLELDSTNWTSLSGPVIHEVTHLNGDTEPQFLDKVFQLDSSGLSRMSTPSPTIPDCSQLGSSSPIEGKRKDESRLKVEPVDSALSALLNPNLKYMPSAQTQSKSNLLTDSRTNLSSSSPDPAEVIVTNVDLHHFGNPDDHLHIVDDILEYDTGQGVVSVTSPNGTTLETKTVPYDPELSPELLQTVNPSVINPNITVNIATPSGFNWTTTTSSSSSGSNDAAARTRGINLTKNSKGRGKSLSVNPSANPSPEKRVSINAGTGVRPSEVKRAKGKSILMGGKGSTTLPINICEPQGSFSTSSDVAIPDKPPFLEKDLSNHLDEVQSSLESLQGIFNSGTLNIDTSTILSLFGNDDPIFVPEHEQWASNSTGVSGTEMSLYNPSLYDMTEDEIDDSYSFASLLHEDELNNSAGSPSKRPRLILKKERTDTTDPSQDDSLSTPRPHVV